MNCNSPQTRFVFALMIIAVVGCEPQSEAGPDREIGQQQSSHGAAPDWRRLMSNDGLTLTAFVTADSVLPSEPVLLVYVVSNGGPERLFVNDPGFFQVQVLGPNGERLTSLSRASEPGTLGETASLLLLTGSVVGRVVDLSCNSSASDCPWHFDFATPGEHQIIVRYDPIPPPSPTTRSQRYQSLQSDTLRLVVRRPSPS